MIKCTKVQDLHSGDNIRVLEFSEQMLIRIEEDFKQKMIWSDEEKFSREGIVYSKNC